MRLYTIQALVGGEWKEWTVLAISQEAAVMCIELATPTINQQSITASEVDAMILETEQSK